MKGCILPSHKKGDLSITKKSRGITVIIAKIYNVLLLNHIQPEIEEIFRKNHNGFQRNWYTTSQILTIYQIIEGVPAKNLEGILLFINFSKIFDSIYREKMEKTPQMIWCFLQTHLHKLNPYCKEQETWASTWMQIRQSTCVSNKKEPSPL